MLVNLVSTSSLFKRQVFAFSKTRFISASKISFRQRLTEEEKELQQNNILQQQQQQVKCVLLHPYNKDKSNSSITGVKKSNSQLRASDSIIKADPTLRLQEATALAETLGWEIPYSSISPMRQISSANFFGKGKLEAIKVLVQDYHANTLVVNARLSPLQVAGLHEYFPDTQIIDRFELILQIFALRAQTRESKLQVELAQLQYKKTTLSHMHDAGYSQQRGGTLSLAGAGETRLEVQQRMIADREKKIKKELADIKKHREQQRKGRSDMPLVAIVGYTNAGKSALVNALTKSDLLSEDQVFASLDPHLKSLMLPSGAKAIVVDTVGFISDLPNILMTAFRSTLEEVALADVILHVRDIANEETDYQKVNVEQVLQSLQMEEGWEKKLIEVWNKTDLLTKAKLNKKIKEKAEGSEVVPISALKGTNLKMLTQKVEDYLKATNNPKLHIPDESIKQEK